MNRVRILRLIARMNVGGPALQVDGLVRHLDPDRFETRLVTGHIGKGEADFLELRSTDLPVHRIPELGRSIRPGDDLRALRSVLDQVRDFKPHILHTHTAKAGVIGRVAAQLAGVPFTVHTFHGHLLHGYFSRPITLAVKWTEKTLAWRTDRLLAVGERVRDDLLEAGIGRPQQYAVMPPGIPAPREYDSEDARRSLGIGRDELVVAFVARLTSVKRPDRFVESAERLAKAHPNVRFLVAGEGPLLEKMHRDAATLDDRCLFLGWVEDVGRVYSASDLVMLTSDNEGMPVSLIEAAMSGVPAVATDVGSVGEVVAHGSTGLIVDLDPKSLADSASALLQDGKTRREFGLSARTLAQERFSIERLVADTSAIYEQLMSRSSR